MTRSRWRRSAALAILCLLPLTACQSRAGAAAFVGDTRIGDNRVQELTAEGLRDPAVRRGVQDVSAYRGIVLSRLIKHELITRAAARLDVKATAGDLDQALTSERSRVGGAKQLAAAAAGAPLGLPESQIEPFFGDLILLDKIGAELTKDLVVTDAELKEFYDQNGGAAAGPFERLKPEVLEAVRRQRAGQETENFVQSFLGTVRVTVNPRYGRFDAAKFFDPQQAPVLRPAPDDFFRGPPPSRAAQPTEAPPP